MGGTRAALLTSCVDDLVVAPPPLPGPSRPPPAASIMRALSPSCRLGRGVSFAETDTQPRQDLQYVFFWSSARSSALSLLWLLPIVD